MKVYLVGDCGPEHNSLNGIYLNKEKALAAFHEHRLYLLENAKHSLEFNKKDAKERLKKGVWYDGSKISDESMACFKKEAEFGDDMYIEEIKNLSEEDPEKISNYPQETPYLREMEVIE